MIGDGTRDPGGDEPVTMRIWGAKGDAAGDKRPDADALVETLERLEQGWFWATDREGRLTYLSAHLAMQVAADADAVLGQPFATLLQLDEESGQEGRSLALLLSRRSGFDNLVMRPPGDRPTRWWRVAGTPRFDGAGQFTGFCGTGLNITEQRTSVARASRLALYDPLTGLPNRLHFTEQLGAEMRAAELRGRSVAALLIDLDRFKGINDTLGHHAGDLLLKQVADRLRRHAGEDRAFRLGGDEFLLLHDDADTERLGEMAMAVIAALSEPYCVNDVRCVIGASVGVCRAQQDGNSVDELVRSADLALYAAKHDGRGCFRFYTPDLLTAAEDRRQMESDLRDALARGEFELAYQPYVDADSHCLKGVEALVRWRHPVRGYVSPALFVPVAEDADLIGPLGEWVLRQACADAARWPASTRVSVNISPLQFADEALPSLVVSALTHAGLAPDRLELEVTEGVFLDDSLHAETMFAQLKALGVRLALDDFGTGYSSLGYLRTAPFDKIKIDQSFVRAATLPGSRNKEIVAAIVSLAEAVGMETTVEGVESLDVLDLMRELRATYVQGFVFSKAVSAATLEERLADGEWRLDPAGPARQRSSRQSIYRAVGVVFGRDYLPAIMRNLSSTGALVEVAVNAPPGALMVLDLGQRQIAMARVRRVAGTRYGLEFEDPLVDDGRGGLRTRRRVPHQLMRQAGLPAVVAKQAVAGVDPEQLRARLGLPSAARLGAAGNTVTIGRAGTGAGAGGSVADVARRYLTLLNADPQRRDQDRAYIADHLEPALGHLPAGALSPARIDRWLAAEQGRELPARILQRLRFIASQVLGMAVHDAGASGEGGAQATLFDRRDLAERILDLDEARRLGAAAQGSANAHLKLVLCLLLLTGLRLREILQLRWEEVDLTGRRFRLGAGAAMSDTVATLLARLPRLDGVDWVLANPQTGKPYRSLQEGWAATLRRADLSDVELEDLRHGVLDEDGVADEDAVVALFLPPEAPPNVPVALAA